MQKSTFDQFWALEAIRLKETHDGPLDDSRIIYKLQQEETTVDKKILQRALFLAKNLKLDQLIQKYTQSAKYALFALLLLAIIVGATSAYAALGKEGGQVNLFGAWLALLGLHFISFFLWLISFIFSRQSATFLGQAWFKLNKKMTKGPNTLLIANAFEHLLRSKKITPWLLASLTHLFWTLFLLSALLALIFLLSTRSYLFVWETTILSSNSFEFFSQTLGALPQLFFFPTPEHLPMVQHGEIVQASDNLNPQWSAWLIGQLLMYGIILRLICFSFSYFLLKKRFKKIQFTANSPTDDALIERLSRQTENIGIDAPAPILQTPKKQNYSIQTGTGQLIVGLELSPFTQWPPFPLKSEIADAGKIDSREQRHLLLKQLATQAVKELLIVCDATQTPDRGILNLINHLSDYAKHTQFFLINSTIQENSRAQLWLDHLKKAGFDSHSIYLDQELLHSWKV